MSRAQSIDDGDGVDLDQAARIGGEPHHLYRGRGRFGIAEILAPNLVERILVGEIGDKAVGGDHVGKAGANRIEAALEVFQRRARLAGHVARHGVELFRPMRVMMIDRRGSDAGEVNRGAAFDLDRRRIGHPNVRRVRPMDVLDGFGHMTKLSWSAPRAAWQYSPVRRIPQGAGLYLAALELVFALGWTVYAIYLPRLAASAGIAAGTVIYILMLDQAIFTVTDFAMGVAADKMSRLIGRLGHWVAAITALSCLAFVGLPFVAGAHLSPASFLALTITWAVTSSALRAPPLMLLGRYVARPAIPYLASLAMVGVGIAGAVSPYLAMTLANEDPRLPFIVASVALVLTSLALSKVERHLAK